MVNIVFMWDVLILKIINFSHSQWNKKWISSSGHLLHKGHIRSSCCTYHSLWVRIWDAPTLNVIRTSQMCLFITEVKFDFIYRLTNLSLVYTCSCQFWAWQSISLFLNTFAKWFSFCTPLFCHTNSKLKLYILQT